MGYTPIPTRGDAEPPLGGEIRCRPEDFDVTELPIREPSGEGTHVWAWVEKRGLSTPRMLDALAKELGVASRQLGYAGLKDAVAVTKQWVSIPPEAQAQPETAAAIQGSGWRVLRAGRHTRGLRPGALQGNRFSIVIRGLDPDQQLDEVQRRVAGIAARGVVNGFGPQRFGKRGDNVDRGLDLLLRTRPRDLRRIPKYKLRLLVSAVQSEVFHRVLAHRVDQPGELRMGDLAWLHRNGACFLVEDPAREQRRAESFEISPTGPLPGPKAPFPGEDIAALEAEALASLGLTLESFGVLPHKLAPGDRRPLRVPLGDAEVCAAPPVEAGDGTPRPLPAGIALSFSLPSGSYATAVLGEICGQDALR